MAHDGRSQAARVGLIAVIVAAALFVSASAGLAMHRAGTVSPDRWIRGVCRGTSEWLEAGDATRAQVNKVGAALAAGDRKAKVAAKRWVQADAQAANATEDLIAALRSGEIPNVVGGKGIVNGYAERLAEYRDAYERARTDLARVPTKDDASFAVAAQTIEATLTADLAEVGGDPIEDLRTVTELTTPIAASCATVDRHLAATIAPAGCTAALATAREYVPDGAQYEATPEGSPENAALWAELDALITRWRGELGGCNNAAVLGPCKPTLDTAQLIVAAAATWYGTPPDSPEEQAAANEWSRLDAQLVTVLVKCPAL